MFSLSLAALQLKEGLVPFIKELRERGTSPDASVLSGEFDSKVQVGVWAASPWEFKGVLSYLFAQWSDRPLMCRQSCVTALQQSWDSISRMAAWTSLSTLSQEVGCAAPHTSCFEPILQSLVWPRGVCGRSMQDSSSIGLSEWSCLWNLDDSLVSKIGCLLMKQRDLSMS